MASCTSVKSQRDVLQDALEDESKQQPPPEHTARKQLSFNAGQHKLAKNISVQ